MEWLELNEQERRDKSLTIRVSTKTHFRFSEIQKYLSKKHGHISQGDLFEQWVCSAYKELCQKEKYTANGGNSVD